MKKKVSLPFVILILLIAFIILDYHVTGFVVRREKTIVMITPENIQAGKRITIEIKPGIKGTDKVLTIHSENGLRKGVIRDLWCPHSYKCKEDTTITYVTSTSWKPGKYHIRAYDYTKREYVKGWFTIIE